MIFLHPMIFFLFCYFYLLLKWSNISSNMAFLLCWMKCWIFNKVSTVGKRWGASPLTRKKSEKSATAKDHMLFCGHIVSIEDFKILAANDSDFHVKVKESLFISRHETILNKNKMSLLLHLFDHGLLNLNLQVNLVAHDSIDPS